MKTSTIKMLSGLALGAGLAFTATTAHADNYRRYFVPDYDQVRGAIFDIEGLPNNGSMYCVPTAAMNIMSYIAQRGFPFVPPSTGDFGPDADTAAYNELTNWLEILGNEMGTSATGGTSGEGAEAGITAFLESGAPGQFSVTRCYVSDDFCPPPSHLAFHAITGGLVMQRIGWYDAVSGFNSFNRTGGHLVTLNGLNDYETSQPTMRWRDPGSDEGNMFFQSEFTTNSSDTLQVVGTFDGLPRTQYRLTGYNGPAFIDGYIAIRPKFAIFTTLPHTGFGLKAPNPVTPDDPGNLTFDMPGGETVGQVALGWDQLSLIATTIDPTTGMHAFQRFSIGSPDPEPILIGLLLPGVQKVREAACRRMYVLADGSVHEYEFNIRGVAVETATTDGTVDALDYAIWRENFGASSSSACIGLLNTASEFVMLDDDLQVASRWFLPNAAAIGPDARMDFGPDGSLWVFSNGTGFNYVFGTGATMQLVDTINFGAVLGSSAPVGGVQVMDNGRMHVEIGGSLRTLEKNAASGWGEIPSQFTGLSTNGGPWLISDNASNFIPGVHDTEAWNDVFPSEFPGVTPECPWDLNKDGITNFDDLNIVLNNWG
ncbi:MAG: hypothetical protein KDA21_11710, partial [Phycisphaerales bacterium]|nr:hypothetical protein [Phycisphaerales bacterium]